MNTTNATTPAVNPHRQPIGLSLVIVAGCLYLPFSWLLMEEPDWSDYLLHWIKLWPILPGLIPGAFLFHPYQFTEFITMGLTTVMLLTTLTWIGSRNRYGLLVAAAIALLVAIPSSIIAHGFYWL